MSGGTRLYLVRHGQAKTKDQDPERGLTEEGRREAESVAALVAGEASALRSIWHSGKKRAAETAAILALQLAREGTKVTSQAHAGLSPEDPVDPLVAELAGVREDLAIVGHLPYLDRLAVRLLGADPGRVARVTNFAPASMLCLERLEDAWLIAWFVTPSVAPG